MSTLPASIYDLSAMTDNPTAASIDPLHQQAHRSTGGSALTTVEATKTSSTNPLLASSSSSAAAATPSATRSSHQQQPSQSSMAPLSLCQSSASTSPLSGRLRLDILLANGQRRCFDFRVDTQVEEVREEIWKTWPEEWPCRPTSSSALRLLHLGHILSDNTILGPAPPEPSSISSKDLKKPVSTSTPSARYRGLIPGRTTVVHLLVKGGWMSEEERMQEERERLNTQEAVGKKGRGARKGNTIVTTQAADGHTVSDGEHGGSGCCCVIC